MKQLTSDLVLGSGSPQNEGKNDGGGPRGVMTFPSWDVTACPCGEDTPPKQLAELTDGSHQLARALLQRHIGFISHVQRVWE